MSDRLTIMYKSSLLYGSPTPKNACDIRDSSTQVRTRVESFWSSNSAKSSHRARSSGASMIGSQLLKLLKNSPSLLDKLGLMEIKIFKIGLLLNKSSKGNKLQSVVGRIKAPDSFRPSSLVVLLSESSPRLHLRPTLCTWLEKKAGKGKVGARLLMTSPAFGASPVAFLLADDTLPTAPACWICLRLHGPISGYI